MKKAQTVMVWFLPIIVIGGLFYPALGYLVVAMMVFLLVLSFFKARYWCWNFCPRGAFLDGVMSKFSPQKPTPKIFTKQWFRWSMVIIFMVFLFFRISHTGGSLIAIGAVFVSMCLITTVISIVLSIFTKHRAWCVICPMGKLQETISKASRTRTKQKKTGS